MRLDLRLSVILGLAAALVASAVQAAPVLMISIDGLRPGDVLEAGARGVTAPNLEALVAEGAYAQGVRGVQPTLTYPSHTTLITGVSPGRHGIANNLTFDPFFKNQVGWYWYAQDIKVPTLWEAAHAAGLKTVNVHWPVSVGAKGIDLNLPQIWRAGTADDRKLLRALATPGLVDRLEREVGRPYADGIDESVEGDELRERFAERLMVEDKPGFATVYFTGLDHTQHAFGPDTPEAHAALARIDAALGRLVAAARRAQPDLVVVVVSDHGFAPVKEDVNLIGAFVQAGLIRFDPVKREVTGWDAEPWFAGGSAQIVLARPEDKALRARVEALLEQLKANPALGIESWVGADQIAAEGGSTQAQYLVSFRIGWEMAKDPFAPLVGPGAYKGMHGYPAADPEMRSTLIVAGPGLKAHGSLGEVDMRDIAPSVAALLHAALPAAEGRPLF
jgi:predicted AlkP superfamily pyrophosphatase or phosphodiesterase